MQTVKETLTIHTPEQVGFQYEMSGLGTRSIAFLLDILIRGLFVLIVFSTLFLISRYLPDVDPTGLLSGLSETWLWALGFLVYGILDLGYFIIFEALWSGQTPGKRMQKLRVIRTDGQPIGWLESATRNILRAVDLLASVYPLGLIVIFLSPRSQRIGDYAAGTIVIVERRSLVPTNRARIRPPIKSLLPDIELHLSTLEPEQYQILRSFLQRREQMDETNRGQLSQELTRRLMDRWGLTLEGVSNEDFLEEVVSAYERSRRAI